MKRSTSVVVALIASVTAVVAAVLVRASAGGQRITQDSIVMLGDSITAEADWGELLPSHPIVNEGHSGYTTEQLLAVAERIAAANPAAVFVLTGTNDIRDGHPASWTRGQLEQLVDRLDQESTATIVIQTVLPRADAPAEVLRVNDEIRDLARSRGLRLLDLHPTFDDGTGALRDGETYDGLHLTTEGYERWADELRPVLRALP